MTTGDGADAGVDYAVSITDGEDEAGRQRLLDGLILFNAAASPHFSRPPEEAMRPLGAFVRDAGGAILGGVTAHTGWGWLSIDLVWLDERLRGRGYGTRLMRACEEEARRRGCTSARVTSYGFQAPGFYERLGYRVVGRLDDFPPGSAYFWLRKDFPPR